MGNGDAASGDGYRYVGRGFLQVTGYNGYSALGYADDPTALATPSVAVDSGGQYWDSRGLNEKTDYYMNQLQFNRVTATVTGATLGSVNAGAQGAQQRWANYQRAISVFGLNH